MAVGASALIGGDSYLAIGREIAFGTGVTATAALDFVSSSMKLSKEFKVIEQIERSRTYSKRVGLSRTVDGEIEFYYAPRVQSCGWLLENAFGGAITPATATGETVGGGAVTHTFALGSIQDHSYPSMTINMRKGGATGGKVFEYSGCRVGEMTFSAQIDDALSVKASIMGKDATTGVASVAAFLTVTAAPLLSFTEGRLSVEGTFASLTSSSFWHVESVEFGINNNLSGGAEARRLGSDTVAVLPPGIADLSLKATIRFDTTTAWDAMVAATQLSVQLEFLGPTLSGSAIRQGLRFDYPRVYVADAGEPEVKDASGVLQSEVTFHVLRDDTSVNGYALQAKLTTDITSFA